MLHSIFIVRVNSSGITQVKLRLLTLVTHHVRGISLKALYFPRASEFETLLGTGVGFHLGHNKCFYLNGGQR